MNKGTLYGVCEQYAMYVVEVGLVGAVGAVGANEKDPKASIRLRPPTERRCPHRQKCVAIHVVEVGLVGAVGAVGLVGKAQKLPFDCGSHATNCRYLNCR
jgi:hypothetical protein